MKPPYRGPHNVIARTEKTLTIFLRDRQINVSAERVRAAYVFEGTRHDASRPPAQTSNDTVKHVTSRYPLTILSGRPERFPARYTT